MSIVCAVKKGNEITIAGDTQQNFGSIKVSNRHLKNTNKIFQLGDSFVGIVGWNAVVNIMEYLFQTRIDLFKFQSRNHILEGAEAAAEFDDSCACCYIQDP